MEGRTGVTETERRSAVVATSRRAISDGGRPIFQLRIDDAPDGLWVVDDVFGVRIGLARPSDAEAIARGMIAEILDVQSDSFDVALDSGASLS